MPTRARLMFALLVVTLASSLTASSLADLQASSAAIACCAKTDYTCTGMSAPDDCCRRMHHTATRAAAGTLASTTPLSTPVALIVLPFAIDVATTTGARQADSFSRPHDPAHLHAYSLLI